MKRYNERQETKNRSGYGEYEGRLVLENGYKAYLGYCVKEGCLDPEEAQDIAERKDWKRVEYMMSYGEYLAESIKDEGGDRFE
jgi:hypothetical protein